MRVSIKVEKVEFDAEQVSLRVNGVNVKENEFIKLGQYHTVEIEMQRPLKLEKGFYDIYT